MNRSKFLDIIEANTFVNAKRVPFLSCKAETRRTQYIDELGTGFEILTSYLDDVAYLDLIHNILYVSKVPSTTSAQHIRKYAHYNNVRTIVYMCKKTDRILIQHLNNNGLSYNGEKLPKKTYNEIISHDYAELFNEVV